MVAGVRIALIPGVPALAHDAYVAGEGILRVSLLGLVPLDGEVAWLLPSGPMPYWRARITRIGYQFAR